MSPCAGIFQATGAQRGRPFADAWLELFPRNAVRLKNLQLKPNALGATFPNFVDNKEVRDPTRADRILFRGGDGGRRLVACGVQTFLGQPLGDEDGEPFWASDHKGVMARLIM